MGMRLDDVPSAKGSPVVGPSAHRNPITVGVVMAASPDDADDRLPTAAGTLRSSRRLETKPGGGGAGSMETRDVGLRECEVNVMAHVVRGLGEVRPSRSCGGPTRGLHGLTAGRGADSRPVPLPPGMGVRWRAGRRVSVSLCDLGTGRAAMVRYAILGPIELRDGERRLPAGGPRQMPHLVLLLVYANRAVSADQLIDALWPRQDAAGAVKRLQVAIARLRKTLAMVGAEGESVLRTVPGGYLLAVRTGELDAEVFEARLQDGRRALAQGDAVRATTVLREALELWRGPALAEVAYEDWAQAEIRRLEELHLAAVEMRMEAGLRLGEQDALIVELEALVAAHPGRERLAGQLMLALYRCGRQGDALEVFARTRAYLSSELGLEPGPALRTLQAEILAQSPALEKARDEAGSAAEVPTEVQRAVLPTGVVTFLLTDVEGSTRGCGRPTPTRWRQRLSSMTR